MNKLIALIVCIIFAAGVSQADGQVLKKFTRKKKETAGEAASDRVDREIVKGVNKGLDKLFGKEEAEEAEAPAEGEAVEAVEAEASDVSDRSSSSRSGMDMSGLMSAMGMGGSVDVKDSYNFDAYIEMSITNIDEDGKEEDPAKYISYIDADSPDYGLAITDDTQDGEMLMIFDTENNLMLTLMDNDGEKTGFAVGFNEEQSEAIAASYEEAEEDYDEGANPNNIKKTGKTKKILGYKCDEYQTEDENSIVSIWTTNDLEKKISKTFMRNANFSGMFMYAYYAKGFVMEYVIVDKDDGEKSIMTVTDIDVTKGKSIKTGGYTIMNIGAMEEMEEEE